MRRADRLFLLIQALRGRRLRTAQQLADALAVSVRTVYRDVRDLQLSGVPIEGEAGVGYVLRKGSEIPPLMFDRNELEALVIGTRFVAALTGEPLAQAARTAMIKIDAVTPAELRDRNERSRVFAPPTARFRASRERVAALHGAIAARRYVYIDYVREDGTASTRRLQPICLAFFGDSWVLGAWCDLRSDFRNFRVDRMQSLRVGPESYVETAGRGLADYLGSVGASGIPDA